MSLRQYLSRRLNSLDDANQRILRDMSVIMAFVLVGKGVAAAKEAVIAWRYGVSEAIDAYLFVFNLIGLPISIWYSILSAVYIPLSERIRASDKNSLPIFRSELLGISIILGVIIGIISCILLMGLFHSSLSGLPDHTVVLALDATPWLAMVIPLAVVTHYGSVMTMAEGRHRNTLFEGIPALGLMGAVLIASSGGIYPLIWGSLAGAALHMIILLVALARERGRSFDLPRFSLRSPAWPLLWAGIGVMLLAQTLQSITAVVDQFFAAHLASGSIATLTYSNRVLSLLLTLSATAIARALLPVFSGLATNHADALRHRARRWAWSMLAVGFVIVAVTWPCARFIISILFERGAFSSTDGDNVTAVFRLGLLQIPFYLAGIVTAQALFTAGRYKIIAIACALNLLIKLCMSFALVPIFGLQGLMYGTAIMYAAYAATLMAALSRPSPGRAAISPPDAGAAEDSEK